MDLDDDRRLAGQERYLMGAALERRRFSDGDALEDHAHCEFCWGKFGCGGPDEETLDVGFRTRDGRRWICARCFDDFKVRFDWTVS